MMTLQLMRHVTSDGEEFDTAIAAARNEARIALEDIFNPSDRKPSASDLIDNAAEIVAALRPVMLARQGEAA